MPCLIISFIWVLEELSIDIYSYALKDLDFWMVELIIITYLNAYMFKIQIYKHQKCAIWFTTFPCFLKVLTIILYLFDENKEIIPILYNVKRIFIPIGIIIYLILITLRSYVNTKIKYFMDFKYISSSKLLMYYGLTFENNEYIDPFLLKYLHNKLKKEIKIKDYILNPEIDDFDLAKQSFIGDTMDTYRNLGSYFDLPNNDDTGYILMLKNLKYYMEDYNLINEIDYFKKIVLEKNRENIKRVIELEKMLLQKRINLLQEIVDDRMKEKKIDL